MDVVVVGKHGEVDARLRAVTVEKVERVAKFVSDVRRIDVDYAFNQTRRAADSHTCEILVHVRQHLVKGSAASSEYLVSLDRALDKVEQQMRRLHGRRVGRRNGTRARDGAHAAADTNVDEAGADDHTLAEVEGDDARVVVKTKQFDVKPMDVGEAMLQMELLGHDFYVFTNADSGAVSVIYRRRDGRFGLIEARR